MDAVKVSNLTKIYHKKTVINSISFNLELNKCAIFLGMDNSGKTTLVNMLAKAVRPSSGSIDYSDNTFNFMPEEDGLSEHLTVYENLYLMARAYHYSKEEANDLIKEYATKFDLLERYDDKVKTLSVSIKKLVSFILLLITKSDILILDEPLKNVDIKTKRLILSSLEELKGKKTIILTTELAEVAKDLADELFLLKDGSINKIDNLIVTMELENKLINAEVIE